MFASRGSCIVLPSASKTKSQTPAHVHPHTFTPLQTTQTPQTKDVRRPHDKLSIQSTHTECNPYTLYAPRIPLCKTTIKTAHPGGDYLHQPPTPPLNPPRHNLTIATILRNPIFDIPRTGFPLFTIPSLFLLTQQPSNPSTHLHLPANPALKLSAQNLLLNTIHYSQGN